MEFFSIRANKNVKEYLKSFQKSIIYFLQKEPPEVFYKERYF